ncbi:copper homeostasis protein CutC [Maribacter sp. X9]|uniref:copper homeostasis protein CutC n=1 Tax=Maribacter sp. X9 TaxID=3402159 RepID=UPI003AF3B21F
MLVEVCANSLESALVAERAGAHRIELCSELAVGGLTPSYGLLKAVKKRISIPVHVLIRPRSGDFTYTDDEFDIMLEDIRLCVELGFEGVVAGILFKNFSLDVERTQQLKSASGDLKFTFHRAFDWVRDSMDVMKKLEELGIDYILSSGQQKTALEGMAVLTKLNEGSSRIKIMPGSGVNAGNVHSFLEQGFSAVHLSGTEMVKTLLEKPVISMNSIGFLSDDHIATTQLKNIETVVAKVK